MLIGKAMNKLMDKMMVSCKKASELTEKHSVSPLTLVERAKLKMHLRMCGICKCYQHQSKLIDSALAQIVKMKESRSINLSEEKKNEILKALNSSH